MKYLCLEQRLICMSAVCPETGCWVWLGGVDKDGYGQLTIRIDGRPQGCRVHRVAYELFHGVKLADDETLDHQCKNRRCLHPNHVYPMPAAVNTRLMWARRRFRDSNGIAAPF